jgi:hypothetical protein
MIHSTHSEFASGGTKVLRSSHSRQDAHGPHASSYSPGISRAVWPVLGFGHEPETNSLWDTGLLDRLSVPLTRYHE